MVELVVVIVLLGVLSAVALPRLGVLGSLGEVTWREQVKESLLHARTAAQGHRRLVCVQVATGSVRLDAAALWGDTTCVIPIVAKAGDAAFALDRANTPITVTPAAPLYFQPDGRITSDAAGTTTANATIAVGGEPVIAVVGSTGAIQ